MYLGFGVFFMETPAPYLHRATRVFCRTNDGTAAAAAAATTTTTTTNSNNGGISGRMVSIAATVPFLTAV
jgi:hypothetical protein